MVDAAAYEFAEVLDDLDLVTSSPVSLYFFNPSL